MTEKSLFICDVCGNSYDAENDAWACEHTHANPTIITKKIYRKCAVYPIELTVRMSNGDFARYVCSESKGSLAFEAVGSGRSFTRLKEALDERKERE